MQLENRDSGEMVDEVARPAQTRPAQGAPTTSATEDATDLTPALIAEAAGVADQISAFEQMSSHDVVVETAAGRTNLTEMLRHAAQLLLRLIDAPRCSRSPVGYCLFANAECRFCGDRDCRPSAALVTEGRGVVDLKPVDLKSVEGDRSNGD